MQTPATAAALPIDAHFDRIRANLIRCEQCNENFFFDFLRHPRYFVTHFKTCHLKNVLYRFNGCSEEENQRVRFGPRRKKDAMAWFGQLKSTEKRMISMQDNKWGEIAERECWSCRLCTSARKSSDMPHAFEPNELGRRQAFVHLRQSHVAAYNDFMRSAPAIDSFAGHPRAAGLSPPSGFGLAGDWATNTQSDGTAFAIASAAFVLAGSSGSSSETGTSPSMQRQHEAERSRLRRLRATPEARQAEAQRSKRRREQQTPAQRQGDAERRARKKQDAGERVRSRKRRAEASPEAREREMKRSRERRLHATDEQRQREAERSRKRRKNASEEQRMKERERCRRRYENKKQQKLLSQQADTASGSHSSAGTVVSDGPASPPLPTTSSSSMSSLSSTFPLLSGDLQNRNQQLQQQQAGLGRQLQSLYASLTLPSEQQER